MKLVHFVLTGTILLTPFQVMAASSMYQLFYEGAMDGISTAELSPDFEQYIIEEMKKWEGEGIILTGEDIRYAVTDKLWGVNGSGLCVNKQSVSGVAYDFTMGGTHRGSCTQLQADILALIVAERQANQLGADLLAITNGAELAVADEPHRPVNMAEIAMLVRRIWSGTGASVLPWDGTAESDLQDLDDELQGMSTEDLDKAILRFHHGYFRDLREEDPRFSGIADSVGGRLNALASTLRSTGNPDHVGIFAIPKLKTPNVALWARRDDIGLHWIYPSHITRLRYEVADQYPELVLNSETLAYPFEYEGSRTSPDNVKSPVCSRTMGREGYLCRPLPDPEQNCDDPSDPDAISLVLCDEKVTRTVSGPSVCADFGQLFADDGTPLEDPSSPGEVNPALTEADVAKICSPERKILYKDDIESHACYIAFCLLQSMSGHTLVPNRSPVVMNEAQSPYLACMRTDPQIGLYTELVGESPYPMPEYQGSFLVRDFDRAYCGVFGDAPQPLGGLCAYNDNAQAALPHYTAVFNAQMIEREGTAIRYRQEVANSLAAAVGQRVALDQSAEVQRKTFAKLANFIDQIASLILELRHAPLTQTACPWTGHFRSSSASTP